MTTVLRVATFNASLNRSAPGALIDDLSTPGNAQARTVAEIIQRAALDVVLVNEFDFDAAGSGGTSLAAELFRTNYLSLGQNGASPIDYPYAYVAPSNTGIASGFDLNNNGVAVTTPGTAGYGDDALGFGAFPGQFGMLLLSKHPIDLEGVRTFQTFLWKDMPGARLPDDPATEAPADWYSPEELEVFRLSSKSHWDVPITVDGEIVHILAAHPTPPVFDGPEDRNGQRNADEIRFWTDYVTPGAGDYIYDDQGRTGGLAENARFVVLGDYNNDPNDGDGIHAAIQDLLDAPAVDSRIVPTSPGGPQQAALQGGANAGHTGDPAFDTADFADSAPGNLRADYVLPSHAGITPVAGQVFWPLASDPLFPLVGTFNPGLPGGFPSSDHRLVAIDLEISTDDRKDVAGIEFLGEVTLPTGAQFDGTEVGGLSGITYDKAAGVFYAISDDRSQIDPARFYTLTIDLADLELDPGDVAFTDVTTVKDASGTPFPALSLDPEGIARAPNGLYISSEGEAKPGVRLTAPFVNRFGLDGQQSSALPVDPRFLPTADRSSGIRDNLAFESLTVTPDGKTLYTATENALLQDGPAATRESGTASRIVRYDVATGDETAEFVYITDPVAAEPVHPDTFATNGLVDLLALDNRGTLLAVERSFSNGVGNTIKIYEVGLQGATDVSETEAIETESDDGELEVEVGAPARKELVLDLADLGIPLDNIEGISFGPTLPGGRPSLILVSDNNFSGTQFTQVLAFALDLEPIPTIEATVETPSETDFADSPLDVVSNDPDDPAIWLNPFDADESVVVTSHKVGGLRVYDLAGNQIQSIEPVGVRYNNVDVLYSVKVGRSYEDLFVASDRINDTLAVFAIDPETRLLSDVTATTVPASIFGVDDGEATAYGLDAYRAPDGTAYVFVTQAAGDKIAQLKLVDAGGGKVAAELVRVLHLPNPEGADPEDLQSEGIVVDDVTGTVCVAVESGGIYEFAVDPAAGDTMTGLVAPDAGFLVPDLVGLAIRYADDGSRQLFVSSQGDATYSVLDLDTGALIGRLAIGDGGTIDGAEESDGVAIYSGPLGSAFPNGLLVMQDGSNEPQTVFPDPDDGEVQNFDQNFKLVPLERALDALDIDSTPFSGSPRPRVEGSLSRNGVASGEVSQHEAVLWANPLVAGRITVEVATDPAFAHVVATRAVDARGDAPIKVAIEGLEEGTDYHYRVTGPDADVAIGAFSTAEEHGHRGVTFGVSGDWRGGLTPYSALANADDRHLDFFVELGDTIYADIPSPAFPAPQATTLDDYRIKYEETLTERGGANFLADLRAATPVFATIDDHEVTNDFAGGAPATSDPRFDPAGADFINETSLYADALEAFHDFQPISERTWSGTGDDRIDGAPDLYRTQTYGENAAIFVLDTRSFRDEELTDADPSDPADVARFLAESFDPSRTLLGKPQLERLKADLKDAQESGVVWKFVMVPEPIQNLGPLGAADRFEGYAAERTELLSFIDAEDIDNVVFVTADIHGTLVNNLTYQAAPGGPQIALDAFEISTGAVAFSPPLGEAVVGFGAALGLLTPEQEAFYESLPVHNDRDSAVDDKDDFVEALINQGLDQAGYDRLGLDDNLAAADGLIDARLLRGDYVAVHTFGWTELKVRPRTQQLIVTTYGISPTSEAEAAADPAAIAARDPVIVSQFKVNPDLGEVGRWFGRDGERDHALPGDDVSILDLGGIAAADPDAFVL